MQSYQDSKSVPNIPNELGNDWWEDLFAPHFNALDWEMFSESYKDSESDDSGRNAYKRIRKQMYAMPTFWNSQSNNNEIVKHSFHHTENNKSILDGHLKSVTTQTEECMWNSKEVELMRQYIKEIKNENSRLRAYVMEQSRRLEELERKCSVQYKQLEKKRVKMSDLIKANDRFNILTQALSEHNERGSSLCSQLEEEIAKKQEIIGHLEIKLSETMKKDASLEQENKKLKGLLNHAQAEYDHEKEIILEKAKLSQANEIRQLKCKLDESEIELRREKERHQATKKGLEQVMKHYSQQNPGSHESKNDPSLTNIKLF